MRSLSRLNTYDLFALPYRYSDKPVIFAKCTGKRAKHRIIHGESRKPLPFLQNIQKTAAVVAGILKSWCRKLYRILLHCWIYSKSPFLSLFKDDLFYASALLRYCHHQISCNLRKTCQTVASAEFILCKKFLLCLAAFRYMGCT